MSRLRFGVTTAAIGFLVGIIVLVALALKFGHVAARNPVVVEAAVEPPAVAEDVIRVRPPVPETPPVTAPAAPQAQASAEPMLGVDPIAELRRRTLDVPVEGIARSALRESFDEMREGTRRHDGIDILAPRNTPVLAVEDGVIAKLFTSVLGGLTVYQYDPGTDYVYYYAHLERYADGLVGGMHVTRHQLIGYVGTTGNAPKGTPHLHFEISRLTPAKQWWKGTAIDPYRVLR